MAACTYSSRSASVIFFGSYDDDTFRLNAWETVGRGTYRIVRCCMGLWFGERNNDIYRNEWGDGRCIVAEPVGEAIRHLAKKNMREKFAGRRMFGVESPRDIRTMLLFIRLQARVESAWKNMKNISDS